MMGDYELPGEDGKYCRTSEVGEKLETTVACAQGAH